MQFIEMFLFFSKAGDKNVNFVFRYTLQRGVMDILRKTIFTQSYKIPVGTQQSGKKYKKLVADF